MFLCSVFLGVQLLFNYEIASHTNRIEVLYNHFCQKNFTQDYKKSDGKEHPAKKVRLNKRFQSEDILTVNIVSLPLPPVQSQAYRGFFYKNQFTSSLAFLSIALRGPPVVA